MRGPSRRRLLRRHPLTPASASPPLPGCTSGCSRASPRPRGEEGPARDPMASKSVRTVVHSGEGKRRRVSGADILPVIPGRRRRARDPEPQVVLPLAPPGGSPCAHPPSRARGEGFADLVVGKARRQPTVRGLERRRLLRRHPLTSASASPPLPAARRGAAGPLPARGERGDPRVIRWRRDRRGG